MATSGQGMARHGAAWRGSAGLGRHGRATSWRGAAGPGAVGARHGIARQGYLKRARTAGRRGKAGAAHHGVARNG